MKKYFFISVLVFISLLFVIPPSTLPSDLGNTLLTVIAFLFGIIGGFYIIITTTDYNSLKNALAEETAGLISLYRNLVVYDKPSATKLGSAIDAYVIKNFSFEIIDYVRETEPEFQNVLRVVEEVPFKESMGDTYQGLQEIRNNIVRARQSLLVLSVRTLSVFQWSVLLALAFLFVCSLYSVRTGDLFFDTVTVVISSSVVLLLLLIRDLDRYRWNEITFGFEIFQNVFKTIGQLPYYPSETLSNKRVVPTEKEYRVGVLVDPKKGPERRVEIRRSS